MLSTKEVRISMPDVKANEREFTGQVLIWLNEAISHGTYPFEIASQETSYVFLLVFRQAPLPMFFGKRYFH